MISQPCEDFGDIYVLSGMIQESEKYLKKDN